MDGTRIYIGNLSPAFKDKDLENIFSQYGTISKLEIKDKLDFDGNSISRFAYLNLVSDEYNLRKCVQALDGKNVNGSLLKVELARESFLEKLKRERQDKQSNNNSQSSNKPQNNTNFNDRDYNFSTESPYERKKSDFLKKQELETNNYDNHLANRENKTRKITNYKTELKNNAEDELWHEKKQPIETTFQIPSLFKRYDPTTAKSNETTEKKEVRKKPPASKKVEISSDLVFHDDSSKTFSLLSKFSSQQEASPKEAHVPVRERPNSQETFSEDEVPIRENGVLEGKESPPRLRKKRNFFISANDPNLQVGAEWLLTPLTDKNLEEFKEIRQELVSIYQTQSESAKRYSKLMPKNSGRQRKKN